MTVGRPEYLAGAFRAGSRLAVSESRDCSHNDRPLCPADAVNASARPSGDSANEADDGLKAAFGGGVTTKRT